MTLIILAFTLLPLPTKEDWVNWFPFLMQLSLKKTSSFQYWDKIVHGIFFFTLGLLFLKECAKNTPLKIVYSFLYSLFLGGSIEIIQLFLSYRSGNYRDFLANEIGYILALAIYFLILYIHERKNLSNCHHPSS